VNLKLRYPVGDPSDKELAQWLDQLPEHLRPAASALSGEERNWLMSATETEQHHWLAPESWDWNTLGPTLVLMAVPLLLVQKWIGCLS
jgi:hypothetical protein